MLSLNAEVRGDAREMLGDVWVLAVFVRALHAWRLGHRMSPAAPRTARSGQWAPGA